MTATHRQRVWILMAVFFLISIGASEAIRPFHRQYVDAGQAAEVVSARDVEGNQGVLRGTSFQTLVPTLLGVREVLASLMWVRADDYFHRGEYRPIISMVRQITTIDPHQLDVYATGAWHMAYNFMDKRLIADGVKFLEEGSKNNDNVYDLYFELGYMHYDKTKDFPQSVKAYQSASTRGTTIAGRSRPPSYVRHQLAHAIEKMGDIDRCIIQWRDNLRVADELRARGETELGAAGVNTSAARHNLYINERRLNERLAAMAERAGDAATALKHWSGNVQLANAWLKDEPGHTAMMADLQKANLEVSRLRGGKLRPVDPTNVAVDFKITRMAPKKLLVEGTINVLHLSRILVRIADKDYDKRVEKGFDFKMSNCTLEYDAVSCQRGKFRREFDLNKDPADMGREATEVYPLKADEYEVSFTYNPRAQAVFIQDRYGWNGEGLTAPSGDLVEDTTRMGVIEGKRYPLRLVRKSIILKREDIVGGGKKQLYPPAPGA